MKNLPLVHGLMLGLFGAEFSSATVAADDLAATPSADHAPPNLFRNAAAPANFGGAADGANCIYDNYNPLDDLGVPASQLDTAYTFYFEAADDFILSGDPNTECLLSEVTVAVAWFNGPGGETPFACWSGVDITIYEDILAHCDDPIFPSPQPAGRPIAFPPFGHDEYCEGGVKCQITASMDNVSAQPLALTCMEGSAWEIVVSGLEEVSCRLERNNTYWISIAPVQVFADCGLTGILLSANPPTGQPAQQFPTFHDFWTLIGGNVDACPPVTPPAGAFRDLSIAITAIEVEAACPWDLVGAAAIVDAADLAALLGDWGNPYGPADLAALLGAWGPCP